MHCYSLSLSFLFKFVQDVLYLTTLFLQSQINLLCWRLVGPPDHTLLPSPISKVDRWRLAVVVGVGAK